MTAELDTKGLQCPLPVLKARKAMKDLSAGDELRIFATDPGAVKDFAEFCSVLGHELVESSEANGVFTFLIRKGA